MDWLAPRPDRWSQGGTSLVLPNLPFGWEDIQPYLMVTLAKYAADRNGAVDATLAIQRALDDSASNGAMNVFLPPGVYKISGGLDIYPGVTIRGSGIWHGIDSGHLTAQFGSILRPTGALDYVIRARGTVGTSVESNHAGASLLADFGIDGSTSQVLQPLRGIKLENFAGIELSRVRISHINGPCLNPIRSGAGNVGYRLLLHNCWFSNSVSFLDTDGTIRTIFLDAFGCEARSMSGVAVRAKGGGLKGGWTGGFMGGCAGGAFEIGAASGNGADIPADPDFVVAWGDFAIRDVDLENCGSATKSVVKVRNGANFNMFNVAINISNGLTFGMVNAVDIDESTYGILDYRQDASGADQGYTGLRLGPTASRFFAVLGDSGFPGVDTTIAAGIAGAGVRSPVPASLSGVYVGSKLLIGVGAGAAIDTDPDKEIVTVTAVGSGAGTFTATFVRAHAAGVRVVFLPAIFTDNGGANIILSRGVLNGVDTFSDIVAFTAGAQIGSTSLMKAFKGIGAGGVDNVSWLPKGGVAVAAGEIVSTTVPCPGAVPSASVACGFGASGMAAGVDVYGYVSANDVVTVTLRNDTAAPIVFGSGTLRVWVQQ